MSLIEEIKNRINIVDLANELGLQPTRQDFIYSIYRKEKNRSLKLYRETNTFKCYATDHWGDVIDFYKDYYGIDVKQAVKELAEKVGLDYRSSEKLEVRSKKKLKPKRIEKRVEILKSEKEYFDEKAGVLEYSMGLERNKSELLAMGELMNERKEIQLLVYESLEKFCFGLDEESFDYLFGKERGLKPKTIKHFRLFSIKDLKQTNEYLKDCFTNDKLLISGLFNKKGNFVFSYHKLIIPYIEENKITYLRGRMLPGVESKGQNAEDLSKYISLCNYAGNLSLKRFFNKDILKKLNLYNKLIICEGEFDTMIMHQENFSAMGVPGVTNIPADKIDLIKNYNIFVAFDNDDAGENATHKLIKLINKPIKAIKLKHHKDLTELMNERHNREIF